VAWKKNTVLAPTVEKEEENRGVGGIKWDLKGNREIGETKKRY